MFATRSLLSGPRTVRTVLAAILVVSLSTLGSGCSLFGSGGDGGGNGSTNTPATPTNLTGTSGNSQISLDWTAVDAADTYNVYRTTSSSTNPSDNDPLQTGVSNPAYTDTEVTNGTTYYYAVTAVSSQEKESDPSSTVEKKPFDKASNLSATSGNSQIDLDWSAAAGAETYTVYRSSSSSTDPSSNPPLTTGVSNPTYTDSEAKNGTTYYYVVTSVGSDGNESAPSNEASKTPFSEPGGRP